MASKSKKAARAKRAGKSTAVRKDVAASSAAALTTKHNAERSAQPGIISEIIEALNKAKKSNKMVTVEEITQHLVTKFPDRQVTGMATTVRAQLSRLPREKDFAIHKMRDGRVVRYRAA